MRLYIAFRAWDHYINKFYKTVRHAKAAVFGDNYTELRGPTAVADATYRRAIRQHGGRVYKIDTEDLELAEPTPDEELEHADRMMLKWTETRMRLDPTRELADPSILPITERRVLAWWLSRTPAHLHNDLPMLRKLAGDAEPIVVTPHMEPSPSYTRAVVEEAMKASGFGYSTGDPATAAPCGDNSCIFGPPGGMGTNGGCRCFDKDPRHLASIDAARTVRRLANTIVLLARQLAEYRFANPKADASPVR